MEVINMKLYVDNNTFVTVVKRAAVSLKDTFILNVAGEKNPENGKCLASIMACDGTVQSAVAFWVDVEEVAPMSFIFGKNLLSAVTVLASSSEEKFILEREESGLCKLSCGSAKINIDTLGDAVQIANKDINDEHAEIMIKPDDFKAAMAKGGFAYSTALSGHYEVIKNAIAIAPVKNDDKYQFHLVTSDGNMVAGAHVDVISQTGLDGMMDRIWSLNATVLDKIISGLHGEQVGIYLFKDQVVVRDVNDLFIIVPNAEQFPPQIVGAIGNEMEYNFTFEVGTKELTAATDVALIGVGSDRPLVIFDNTSGNGLAVSNETGTNGIVLPISNENGGIRIGLSGKYLKTICSHLGERLCISGINAKNVISITDGTPGAKVCLCPVNIDTDTDNGAEEKSE